MKKIFVKIRMPEKDMDNIYLLDDAVKPPYKPLMFRVVHAEMPFTTFKVVDAYDIEAHHQKIREELIHDLREDMSTGPYWVTIRWYRKLNEKYIVDFQPLSNVINDNDRYEYSVIMDRQALEDALQQPLWEPIDSTKNEG